MICMNSRTVSPSNDCTDSVVTANDATCGEAEAREESDGRAIVGSDTQNGETAKKGKRKRKNRRRLRKRVVSLGAGDGGGEKEAV